MRVVVLLLSVAGFGSAHGPEMELKAPSPLTIEHYQMERPTPPATPPIPVRSPQGPWAHLVPIRGTWWIAFPMGSVKENLARAEYPSKPIFPLAGDRPTRQGLVLNSAEAPLANAGLSELKLKVLWEAAKQYRDAVERGNRDEIDKAGKVLDDALKATGEPAKSR